MSIFCIQGDLGTLQSSTGWTPGTIFSVKTKLLCSGNTDMNVNVRRALQHGFCAEHSACLVLSSPGHIAPSITTYRSRHYHGCLQNQRAKQGSTICLFQWKSKGNILSKSSWDTETHARLQFPSFCSIIFSESWCHPLTEPLQWLCSLLVFEGAVTVFSAGDRGAPVLGLLCYGSDVKLRVSCQDGSRSHFLGLGLFIVPCTMALLPPAASIHHIPLLSNAHKSP